VSLFATEKGTGPEASAAAAPGSSQQGAADASAAAPAAPAAAAGTPSNRRLAALPATGFRPTFFRGALRVTPSGTNSSSGGAGSGPTFPADTFLQMDGWDKGIVWVNGHCLGRYWQSQGPQYSLYCPGPWLRPGGDNEVVVLELSRAPKLLEVGTLAEPDFGLDRGRD
jgi:hypothetical protein